MSTKTKQTIPLLDLNAQYEPIKEQILNKIKDVFDSKYFINGPEVENLEKKAAAYCGTNYALGISSGTDALLIALMALDIKAGDEVITCPFTFFATAGAIARVGATPVFCDINPNTFNIDISKIESLITKNTKAIIPIHLFGQCADMEAIINIATKHKISVIEDAAQAIGSEYTFSNGTTKKAGNIGTIGCFSFFPSKNLGACGDAGLVTTNDQALYEKLKSLRMHGETQRYHHKYIGGNFRIDAMQAAILSIKLNYLEEQHEGRIKNANYYNRHLESRFNKPQILKNCKTIYNQYTIKTDNRAALQQHLNDHTIGNNIYYPIPLHLQECFAYLNYKEGDFPESEKAAKTVLSLPVYSELSEDQLKYVVDTLNTFKN